MLILWKQIMSNDITKATTTVAIALDKAFKRAQEQERVDGEMSLDISTKKYVIFSDHHKGNRDGADDFRICERAYNAALAYYYHLGYTLVVLGDVEELWEERPKTVLKAYPHTLMWEGKFHQEGRYLRFWGNHDDDWSHSDLVDQLLAPALGGGLLKVRETLILHVKDGDDELGSFFLVHGHQGTFDSDLLAPLAKLIVRYIWRPIQRITKFSFNTPAKDFKLRHAHDRAMYRWSEAHDKIVLIAGHTHRPVFKSQSHEAVIRKSLEKSEQDLLKAPDDMLLQQQTADLAAELEWVLAQNQQSSMLLPPIELKKPSYFNTGCCAYLDGDVTGLEVVDGDIRLVRWPNDEDIPKPKVLASAKLSDVFAAC
jgi:predicted phosphodiesterase